MPYGREDNHRSDIALAVDKPLKSVMHESQTSVVYLLLGQLGLRERDELLPVLLMGYGTLPLCTSCSDISPTWLQCMFWWLARHRSIDLTCHFTATVAAATVCCWSVRWTLSASHVSGQTLSVCLLWCLLPAVDVIHGHSRSPSYL